MVCSIFGGNSAATCSGRAELRQGFDAAHQHRPDEVAQQRRAAGRACSEPRPRTGLDRSRCREVGHGGPARPALGHRLSAAADGERARSRAMGR
jgi:hypothetical protein